MRKKLLPATRAAITQQAVEYIEQSYRAAEQSRRREPCISVGEVTDYLRQAHMPDEFRYATKARQNRWTRSALETLRKKGKLGSSTGKFRCYEPKR